MDGTLWDSSDNIAKAWNETVRSEGYDRCDITNKDIQAVMGKTMDEFAGIIFSDYDKDLQMSLLQKCINSENEYLRKHGGRLYPLVEETLIELKKDYPLYIVSNCQSGYIEAFLEYYRFDKYFDDIECYGNNLKKKAHNIALLGKRNNLDDAYYIGDIQGDYDATIEAGYRFIHAKYGFGTIAANVPELERFSDLPDLLNKF